jgi:predicted aminopeptidase
LKLAGSGLLLFSLCGCLELDYYLHAATGHLQLLSKRQSIPALLETSGTPEQLQKKLQDVAEIRDFASQSLLLPENESYRSYVKLDRPYVVWNVIATPEFSLTPLEWCFPVVGCLSYRGYFDHQKAQEFARSLDAANDTLVVGVPAYSTLSWFDDPVLSTFSDWPEVFIAQLIFHELAHQQLFIADDTVFNESFATAVEQAGLKRWLKRINDPHQTKAYQQQKTRQELIHQLLQKTRSELAELYERDLPTTEKRRQKLDILADLRDNYQQLRSDWIKW